MRPLSRLGTGAATVETALDSPELVPVDRLDHADADRLREDVRSIVPRQF